MPRNDIDELDDQLERAHDRWSEGEIVNAIAVHARLLKEVMARLSVTIRGFAEVDVDQVADEISKRLDQALNSNALASPPNCSRSKKTAESTEESA